MTPFRIAYRAYIHHGPGWARPELTSVTVHRDSCFILTRQQSPGQNRHILTVIYGADASAARDALKDPNTKACGRCRPEVYDD